MKHELSPIFLQKYYAKKSYRIRVELAIWKEGKILITINHYQKGTWPGIPGGGVDANENLEEAALREALEEVGVKAGKIYYTGHTGVRNGYRSAHSDREEKYKGSITFLFAAEYEGEDHSLLGKDGDATDYEWLTPTQARTKIKNHLNDSDGGSGYQLIDYLHEVIQPRKRSEKMPAWFTW